MNNYKKLFFFILILISVPLGFLAISYINKTGETIKSAPLQEKYEPFAYPLVPRPIDATLGSRYPVSKVPKDKEDLSVYEKRHDVINILRIVYRNNTQGELHDVKIKLHVTGMYLRTILSSFSNFNTSDYPPDIIIVPREPVFESGEVNIVELYFYAIQKGSAKAYAEISTREGYRIKTNTLTIGAE